MRKFILVAFLAFASLMTLSGCEKADYQHPLHRK